MERSEYQPEEQLDDEELVLILGGQDSEAEEAVEEEVSGICGEKWVIIKKQVETRQRPKQARDWCGTLNNYTEREAVDVKQRLVRGVDDEEVIYAIVAKEKGESGTKHLQAFFQFSRAKRLGGVKEFLGSERWHLEERRGTSVQASDYCKKEDKDPWKYGTLRMRQGQGKRNDLIPFREALDRGAQDLDLARMDFATWCRNFRAFERYRFALQSSVDEDFAKVDVEVFYGTAGSGKTRAAVRSAKTGERFPFHGLQHGALPLMEHGEYFMLDQPGSVLWWDGYTGQTTLILDDFTGWIRLAMLLKLLDGYKMRLDVKGGHTFKKWKRVIITSNLPPREWYNAEAMARHPGALERRINRIWKMETYSFTSENYLGQNLLQLGQARNELVRATEE